MIFVWPTWCRLITTITVLHSPLMFGRCSTTSSWTWRILTGNGLRVWDQHGKLQTGKLEHHHLFDVKSSICSSKTSRFSSFLVHVHESLLLQILAICHLHLPRTNIPRTSNRTAFALASSLTWKRWKMFGDWGVNMEMNAIICNYNHP